MAARRPWLLMRRQAVASRHVTTWLADVDRALNPTAKLKICE